MDPLLPLPPKPTSIKNIKQIFPINVFIGLPTLVSAIQPLVSNKNRIQNLPPVNKGMLLGGNDQPQRSFQPVS